MGDAQATWDGMSPAEQHGNLREVVLEVPRAGRRPRYHRAVRVAGQAAALRPEQCNLDQAELEVRELPQLPPIKRASTQLCRRCWRGHALLVA